MRIVQARRDARLSGEAFAAFAYLSQRARFQRRWLSLYQVVEDGRITANWDGKLCVMPLPDE
ncbi:MAG: hypothetical protein NZT92_09415 [Abditibacteriales bacterium]|nr:hypothetical protein [Abditibacteriales bacterium]MDW8366206.1 hypothetical protein [Abditibacteriales bacterium]